MNFLVLFAKATCIFIGSLWRGVPNEVKCLLLCVYVRKIMFSFFFLRKTLSNGHVFRGCNEYLAFSLTYFSKLVKIFQFFYELFVERLFLLRCFIKITAVLKDYERNSIFFLKIEYIIFDGLNYFSANLQYRIAESQIIMRKMF